MVNFWLIYPSSKAVGIIKKRPMVLVAEAAPARIDELKLSCRRRLKTTLIHIRPEAKISCEATIVGVLLKKMRPKHPTKVANRVRSMGVWRPSFKRFTKMPPTPSDDNKMAFATPQYAVAVCRDSSQTCANSNTQ